MKSHLKYKQLRDLNKPVIWRKKERQSVDITTLNRKSPDKRGG